MNKISCSTRCGKSACDCREKYFKQIEAENKRLQFEVSRFKSTEFVSYARLLLKKNKKLKAEVKFLQENYVKDPPHKGGAS